MKKHIKKIIALVILSLGMFWAAPQVLAMASIFMAPTKTATATTSPAWITPGTGTTTVTLPTPLALGMATKYDKAYVMVQIAATNSPQGGGALKARVEHSLDGVDWFSEGVATAANATNTPIANQEITLTVSTSSAYLVGASTGRVNHSFYMETPTPHNRVVFYSPIGGASLSVWAAVQPIKEVQVLNQ